MIERGAEKQYIALGQGHLHVMCFEIGAKIGLGECKIAVAVDLAKRQQYSALIPLLKQWYQRRVLSGF